ncbi:MAG TPA: ABC transporter permease [Anaerolineae bacterium]|nr:ABC transporter permease [Anaerolineae bacterium]
MHKTFLIFRHEFIHTIKRVGYIIMTLIMPVLALLIIGAFELVKTFTEPSIEEISTIGFVDEADSFSEYTDQGPVKLIQFDSIEDATQALIGDRISEYIVIPADYISSGAIQRYTLSNEIIPPQVTMHWIKSFLNWNLLGDEVPPEIITSVVSPLSMEITRLEESGDFAQDQGFIGNIIIPGIYSLLLSMALIFGSTSLISGLGEEKESRLLEVLCSSVSVSQLLIGKVLALGSAGLLQVLVWLISAPPLLSLASTSLGGFLSDIQVPANFLALGVLYFILGYLLFAIFSVTLGGISPSTTEAQNLGMFYIMSQFIPLWFVGALINFPNNPVWVVLSIFPLTAPIQIMLRLGISEIPAWQIIASISVLALSILAGAFLSFKTFRLFMLMYGKRPRIADVIRGLRTA